MRFHLRVVSEKKIKIVKNCFFCHEKSSIIGIATITNIANIFMKSGLFIFNTLAVTLRTDDAECRTQDTGRRTYDIVPQHPTL